MSLILDALNRSRRDAAPVPGLDTYHAAETAPRGARAYLPWFALALAVLLIIWLLWDRSSRPEPAVTAPLQEAADNMSSALASMKDQLQAGATAHRQPAIPPAELPVPGAAAPPPNTAPASASAGAGGTPAPPDAQSALTASSAVVSTGSAPAKAAVDTAVAELYERAPEPDVEPRLAEEALAKPAGAVPARDRPAAPPSTGQAAQAARGDVEEPVDLEQLLQRARDEVENAQLVEHPAPFIAELSQQTKNAIPTLYYQRHDYSDVAGRSSVVLNGKPLRVGGSPVSGMKVDDILPDSVILSYQGTQFRLRALNSWINL
ncbi:MAG: general secretion pathway protein GspB [Halioglobus sp.]